MLKGEVFIIPYQGGAVLIVEAICPRKLDPDLTQVVCERESF